MNPRAYDQLNVPTEVEAYIPVQKLFLCCCCRVVFQDRSEKRIIEIRIRSRSKVYSSLIHILLALLWKLGTWLTSGRIVG